MRKIITKFPKATKIICKRVFFIKLLRASFLCWTEALWIKKCKLSTWKWKWIYFIPVCLQTSASLLIICDCSEPGKHPRWNLRREAHLVNSNRIMNINGVFSDRWLGAFDQDHQLLSDTFQHLWILLFKFPGKLFPRFGRRKTSKKEKHLFSLGSAIKSINYGRTAQNHEELQGTTVGCYRR